MGSMHERQWRAETEVELPHEEMPAYDMTRLSFLCDVSLFLDPRYPSLCVQPFLP